MARSVSKAFAGLSDWLSKWMGSHWAFLIAALLVVIGLATFGVNDTNIGISIVTLLMVFVLQNTQNKDSAALHLKLDEIITHLEGPRETRWRALGKSPEIEELKDDLDAAGTTGRIAVAVDGTGISTGAAQGTRGRKGGVALVCG